MADGGQKQIPVGPWLRIRAMLHANLSTDEILERLCGSKDVATGCADPELVADALLNATMIAEDYSQDPAAAIAVSGEAAASYPDVPTREDALNGSCKIDIAL